MSSSANTSYGYYKIISKIGSGGMGEVLLFEPKNVKNTGNVEDEKFTAPVGDKI